MIDIPSELLEDFPFTPHEGVEDPLDDGEPLPPFCDGCGNVVDHDVCHCGESGDCYEHHAALGGNHAFVPEGCRCNFVDANWPATAKGLRVRLREERWAAARVADHLRAVLQIIDRTGGYMSTADQETLRAARKAVARG